MRCVWIALCSNMKSAIFGRLRAVSGFLVHIVAFPGEKASAWWGSMLFDARFGADLTLFRAHF